MKKDADTAGPEFSLPLAVDKVSPSGLEQTVNADAAQRARLAERFGLLELSRLAAELSVTPTRAGSVISVTGRMEADVVQQCVVSLEPIAARIEQDINVLFADPVLLEEGETMEEGEDIEAVVDGFIDLGELLAQHLGVALDPYPRKPGLAYVEAQYGEDGEKANPFAVLTTLGKTPKK